MLITSSIPIWFNVPETHWARNSWSSDRSDLAEVHGTVWSRESTGGLHDPPTCRVVVNSKSLVSVFKQTQHQHIALKPPKILFHRLSLLLLWSYWQSNYGNREEKNRRASHLGRVSLYLRRHLMSNRLSTIYINLRFLISSYTNFCPGELPFVILISSNLQTLPLSGGPRRTLYYNFIASMVLFPATRKKLPKREAVGWWETDEET